MSWFVLSIPVIFLFSFVRGDLTAALTETAKLSSQVKCHQEAATLVRLLRDSRTVPVAAASVNGVLKPVGEYHSRLDINSSGVFLKDVNYNDNGHYEFLCSDTTKRIIRLEVLVISDISASKGNTVKLPCFSVTLGEPVESVQWETKGKPVIRVKRSNQMVKYGERFKDRVSLSPDWYVLGDLSLILERAQLEDQGDYFCYVLKGSQERGDPAAGRLKVHQMHIETSTTPSQNTKDSCSERRGPWWLFAIVATLVGVTCFGI
ncbi:uncharacterized protein si:dkey-22i16.9 isoform X1 [Girardinichthys multiradiatus]|uniref:uncharacterized protein si:dkey-22i16.9 isoform X1 n=1 Tax=Girardinichthys multiradiatus TaxID=208333 RepID=UPI001FAB5C4F|nr:uncharacterized protein si:dkey-22i16.9 isoform X1 [Girardinichthys multiradiatus]